MLAVLLGVGYRSNEIDATFWHRDSEAPSTVTQQVLPAQVPSTRLRLPDTNRLRAALGIYFHGRLLWTFKAITYTIPLRQAFQLYDIARLWLSFRRSKPMVVHINNGGFPGAESCNAAAVAAHLAGVPIVVYMVNNIAIGYRSPLRWADYPLDRAATRCVTRFVTGSQTAASALRALLKLPVSRVIALGNGVTVREPDVDAGAVRQSLGVNDDELLIVTAAVLEPRKGHRVLIEAFSQLVCGETTISGTLVFAGQGPEEAALRCAVADAGIRGRVRFAGQLSNIWNLLAAADIVVLPSIELEDFPISILEAMAMAKPVIASAVAGTTEQVVDGQTGLLVPARDVAALSDALRRLIANDEERRRMGVAGAERFEEHFSPHVAAKRYWTLYRELVAEQVC